MTNRSYPHRDAAGNFIVAVLSIILLAVGIALITGCTPQRGVQCPANPEPYQHYKGY